ncbi:recombinase family protein, partial [Ruminococcus albus]
VQRLLEDAQNGRINLIICKDLSRFGRNYIEVGRYIDYIFPMYNIRFIALTDNVDTANTDSASMDMLPIMNVFNEWHSANTSKKLRAVFEANAKAGKYKTTVPPYGYLKGTDSKHTPVIEPTGAAVVRRIFELRAAGNNIRTIANILNADHIPVPSDHYYSLIGKPNPIRNCGHLWDNTSVSRILNNPIYLGRLTQLRTKTVSYKNHKVIKKDESDWVVIENNHEPIISQELWDRVQAVNASVATGRHTKNFKLLPLSGLCYCADCGSKMRQHGGCERNSTSPVYVCSRYAKYGKAYCSTHTIRRELLESLVLADIQRQIDLVLNEPDIREKLLAYKKGDKTERDNAAKKRLRDIDNCIKELDRLIRSVYEDKVAGLIPDKVCAGLLGEYQEEKDNLTVEYEELSKRTDAEDQDERDVDEYIRRMKSYAGAETLTREMALTLIEYVKVDAHPGKHKAPRTIEVFYKLIDKPLTNKHNALE